jgi:hypothetical protein
MNPRAKVIIYFTINLQTFIGFTVVKNLLILPSKKSIKKDLKCTFKEILGVSKVFTNFCSKKF